MSERKGLELWKLLWDYDPNGLVAVDQNMDITLINPAFCKMFKCNSCSVIGQPLQALLDDIKDFQHAWNEEIVIKDREYALPKYDLYVRVVIFPIPSEGIVAGIFVDESADWHTRQVMKQLRQNTLDQVNAVVEQQMKVAQEIASLLGESTAETKVSLIKIREMLNKEDFA